MDLLTPDICVIGAGSGGLSVAAAAAAFGVPVVLIEKDRMGGECLNSGCVPSKALLAAAKRLTAVRNAEPFGIRTQRATVDFRQVHDHVHRVIGAIAPNDSAARFTGLGVRVVEGAARFKDARTVVVDHADCEIRARRFVVATGSTAAVPPIPGLDGTPYLTNETVFDLRALPKHLIVIGAGPVGLELAQAFRRLGSEVTVLEAGQPLAKDDPECAAIVLDQLARDGVVVRAGTRVLSVTKVRTRIAVLVTGMAEDDAPTETIEGTHLLVATGRQAAVDGLDLDKAGIRTGRDGIVVDKRLRTSNKRVYAIGDVVGGLRFTHVANAHAGIVIRNALFRLPAKLRIETIPWVTFTEPELAQVGLTEAEARRRHKHLRILRWPYHENDRAQAERETQGHIKVVTTKGGTILGATIVGAGAGELIGTWTLAISQGLTIRAMTEIIVPYPALAEIGKRAAISFYTPGLTSRFVRRIIAFLRRFG
jgi:pyruvate/2-oxoglutarate dehydrogenase complex dihydrolipoamide dehydrogenase (E3) component